MTKVLALVTLVAGVASAFAEEYVLAGILVVITIGLSLPSAKKE